MKELQAAQSMSQSLGEALLFAMIASVVLWIAWQKKFFCYPHRDLPKNPVTLLHVIGAFFIYFGISTIVVPILAAFLKKTVYFSPAPINSVALAAWLNLLGSSLVAILLAIFWRKSKPEVAQIIWRRADVHHPYTQDIGMGLLAWIISCPILLTVNDFLDILLHAFFHITELPDQTAVHFLKLTIQHPLYFLLSFISIVGLAPFFEELIFRGFLQTYARKFIGPTGSILVSSICFSCFHYAPEQGLGNISIIGSLFVLALFLGFIYERQGSLLASISLHASFNALSVFNLYFLGGISRGAL
jgi:membrane protease YdiL (CAAX protease family)